MLHRVAAERIREELATLFGSEACATGLALLSETGVYPDLWNAGGSTTIAEATRRRLARLSDCARDLDDQQAVDRQLASQAVILAELGDVGARLRELNARGWLTNRDARNVATLLDRDRLPERDTERRWFLHRTGELSSTAAAFLGSAAPPAVWDRELSALSDLATHDAESIFTPAPLLNGHEIAQALALEPGPRLGELAGELRRAQIEGQVTSRKAALEWLERRR